jgi:hypothetical protein
MRFKEKLFEPSYSRQDDYNSLNDPDRGYSFVCTTCNQQVSFPSAKAIDSEYSWAEEYDQVTIQTIRDYFKMNLVGKSPDGGRPTVFEVACEKCSSLFLVYAGVEETSNSVFRVAIQSIAEISSE